MKTTAISCLILAFAAISSTASADMIAVENFDSYNVGALAGNNGGTGWSSPWVTTSPIVVTVVDPAVDLQGNRAIAFAGSDNINAASRTFSPTLSSDVFVDFKIQFNGTVSNNDFLALWFGSSSGPNIGLKGNEATNDATRKDLFVRTAGSTGNWLTGSNITSGVTYHLFGHLYKSPGSSTTYNRFDAWLNPTDNEMFTLTGADAIYTGTSSISSFNTIGFRTANLDAGDSILIDDLKIRDTAPVPEPGTIALLGCGMIGLALYGKRRASRKS